MGFKIWCQDGGGGTLLSISTVVREFLNIWFCNFFVCFYWIHPIIRKLWKRFLHLKIEKSIFPFLLTIFFIHFIQFCDIKDRENWAWSARCTESAQWDVNLMGDGGSKHLQCPFGVEGIFTRSEARSSSFKRIFAYSAHILQV